MKASRSFEHASLQTAMASQAVQQQLDALAKPNKAPAAHAVADALSDAESSSMEEPAASGKGRRAIARRSSLTVEATAQPTVMTTANGASHTCSLLPLLGRAGRLNACEYFSLLCLAISSLTRRILPQQHPMGDILYH